MNARIYLVKFVIGEVIMDRHIPCAGSFWLKRNEGRIRHRLTRAVVGRDDRIFRRVEADDGDAVELAIGAADVLVIDLQGVWLTWIIRECIVPTLKKIMT